MTRRLARAALVSACVALLAAEARAQDPGDMLNRGFRAYSELDFNAAAGLIRAAVAAGAAQLTPSQQIRALTHLGAAEVFRGNPDSARAAFVRLVLAFPRQRIDELVFPPEVTSLFNRVRATTPVVAIELASEARVELGRGTYDVRLFSSSHHEITAVIARADGGALRTLFAGPIGDSLVVRWNGLDSQGALVPSGAYLLRVFSGSVRDEWQRAAQVPLDLELLLADTVPLPGPLPDSLLRPEVRGAGPGWEALAGGVLTGLSILVVPSAVASSNQIGSTRFAVAGAVSLVGVVGFFTQRPGSPLPRNVVYNDSLRQAWLDDVATARARNAARRQASELVIRAGALAIAEVGGR